jgi:hypothetical protein
MPFKKVGKNKNVSPSGKMFSDKQVKMYYATGGFSKEKIKKYKLENKKKTKSKLTKRKKRK